MSKNNKNKQNEESILKNLEEFRESSLRSVNTFRFFNSIMTIDSMEKWLTNVLKDNKNLDLAIKEDIDWIKENIIKWKEYWRVYDEHNKNPNSTTPYPECIDLNIISLKINKVDFRINRPDINSLIKNLENDPNSDTNIKQLINIVKNLKDLDINVDYIQAIKYTEWFDRLIVGMSDWNIYLMNNNLRLISNLILDNSNKWMSYNQEYIYDLSKIRDNFYNANTEMAIINSEIKNFTNKFSHNEFNYDFNICLTHIRNASLYLRNCIEAILGLFVTSNKTKLNKSKFTGPKGASVVVDMLVSKKEKINTKLIIFEWNNFSVVTNKSEFDISDQKNIDLIKQNYKFLSDNLHYKNVFSENKLFIDNTQITEFYSEKLEEVNNLYNKLLKSLKFVEEFKNHYSYYEKDECLICVNDFRFVNYVPKKIFK